MKLFKTLKNIPSSGIWAFVNYRNKKAYISYSDDILGSVARHIRQIKNKEHQCAGLVRDVKCLKLEILHTFSPAFPLEYKQLYTTFFVDKYRNMGYKLYRNYKGLVYTPYIFIDVSGRSAGPQVFVSLKNKKNTKKIVGVFRSVAEAEEFVAKYYSVSPIFPVYAINKDTKTYVEKENDL